jgi:hypothetical protein
MAKRPQEAFRSTRPPRVTARPPEDPAIAAAQALLGQTILHTAPISQEYSDPRDRSKIPSALRLPHDADLKETSALRPAQRRMGPVADILLGTGARDLSSTAATALFGGTGIPFDQLGTTLDHSEPLPVDPATRKPAIDAEVQRLTSRLQLTGQLGSTTAVRLPRRSGRV